MDNVGRMKKLHRLEGSGMSFREFCMMWADRHRHISGYPLPPPSENDATYSAIAFRVCKARGWKTPS